jgi:uncharacterized protein YbaR (Trm112 family)
MVTVQPPLFDLPQPRVLVTCPRCRERVEVDDPPVDTLACPHCLGPLMREHP